MASLVLIQLVISACLTGLVLLIQFTHYPSFKFIDEKQWSDFHAFHSRSISFVVVPLMLAELALSIYCLQYGSTALIVGFVLVVGIWLNTFLQAVPLHNKLSKKKDDALIMKLVRVNVTRSIFWTLRTILLFYLVL